MLRFYAFLLLLLFCFCCFSAFVASMFFLLFCFCRFSASLLFCVFALLHPVLSLCLRARGPDARPDFLQVPGKCTLDVSVFATFSSFCKVSCTKLCHSRFIDDDLPHFSISILHHKVNTPDRSVFWGPSKHENWHSTETGISLNQCQEWSRNTFWRSVDGQGVVRWMNGDRYGHCYPARWSLHPGDGKQPRWLGDSQQSHGFCGCFLVEAWDRPGFHRRCLNSQSPIWSLPESRPKTGCFQLVSPLASPLCIMPESRPKSGC